MQYHLVSSYPYGKGISALNTLLAQDLLGEVDTTHTDLVEATKAFFCALYSQLPGTSMGPACFKLFTKKKNRKVMALPPTSANLLQLALRAHLQTMLSSRPSRHNESADITHFGWEIRDDIPIPVIAQVDPAPPELIDVIQCQCRAQGKKCSTEACGCMFLAHHSATVLVMRVVAIHTPHEKMLRLEMIWR